MAADADKLGSDVLSSSKYSKEAEEQRASFSAFEAVPLSEIILNTQQVSCGKLDGQDCFAFLHGTSHGEGSVSTEYLQVVVLLSRPLHVGMCVYPERWTSRIGKRFFRMQDIEAGLKEFDEHFIVQAKKETQVGAILSCDSVQKALRPFMQKEKLFSNFVVNDVSVRGTFCNKSSSSSGQRQEDRLNEAVLALTSAASLAAALSATQEA